MKTDIEKANSDEVFAKARDKAVRMLAYRARSRREIEIALGKYFPSDIVSRVIELLNRYSYLDDEKFAEEYIECKVNKGYGTLRIRYELRQKGITEDIINSVLSEIDSDEVEEAVSLLDKRLRGDIDADFAEKRRCYGFLSRRGYSADVINKAFRQYFNRS